MPRPHDLPSAKQLASNKPHGNKMRYMAGCRCRKCRAGNAAYERKLIENRRLHGPNDLVSTERVREHLKYLQQFGMGHKTVAKHAHVGKTALAEILWSGKQKIRRRSEARVLAVEATLDTLPRHLKVPAAETVQQIERLVRWGYPKSLINRDGLTLRTAGMQIHALKRKTDTVAVKTAVRIRDFFLKIEALRALWQERRGPIPSGRYVYWKSARRRLTLEALEVRPVSRNYQHFRKSRRQRLILRALELRPVSQNYQYHYLYPPELKATIRAANQLTRAYRKRRRDEKHNGRSSEPPVRNHRRAA